MVLGGLVFDDASLIIIVRREVSVVSSPLFAVLVAQFSPALVFAAVAASDVHAIPFPKQLGVGLGVGSGVGEGVVPGGGGVQEHCDPGQFGSAKQAMCVCHGRSPDTAMYSVAYQNVQSSTGSMAIDE